MNARLPEPPQVHESSALVAPAWAESSAVAEDKSTSSVSETYVPTLSEQNRGTAYDSSAAVQNGAGLSEFDARSGGDSGADDSEPIVALVDEDDDEEQSEAARKVNWWIWGPIALVGLMVLTNLFKRR